MTNLEIAQRLQRAVELDSGILARDLNCAQRVARILIPVVEQIVREEARAKSRADDPGGELLNASIRKRNSPQLTPKK